MYAKSEGSVISCSLMRKVPTFCIPTYEIKSFVTQVKIVFYYLQGFVILDVCLDSIL